MSKTLEKAVGNWVSGDKFWGRQVEIARFLEYLEAGASILLVAPRRMGKTSLMREAGRLMEGKYIVLQVDLQKCEVPEDAIAELSVAVKPYESLWKKTKGLFANILDKVAERVDAVEKGDVKVLIRSGLNAGNWKAKGDEIFTLLADAEKPVVIFFDEVPILVNRILKGGDYHITPERKKQADAFMSWLRANNIKHKDKIRQVITGSIGLEPVLRQANLSGTLNSHVAFDLHPWSAEEAIGSLAALANRYQLILKPMTIQRMLKKLGYLIPFHVQMFFDHIHIECRRSQLTEVTDALVDQVYQASMLSSRGHAELSTMEERLNMVLGTELFPLAIELLTETAVVGKLKPKAAEIIVQGFPMENYDAKTALREVLGILEHDGYIKRSVRGNTYEFLSKLLRDWWKARFGFGYKPAEQREENPSC